MPPPKILDKPVTMDKVTMDKVTMDNEKNLDVQLEGTVLPELPTVARDDILDKEGIKTRQVANVRKIPTRFLIASSR